MYHYHLLILLLNNNKQICLLFLGKNYPFYFLEVNKDLRMNEVYKTWNDPVKGGKGLCQMRNGTWYNSRCTSWGCLDPPSHNCQRDGSKILHTISFASFILFFFFPPIDIIYLLWLCLLKKKRSGYFSFFCITHRQKLKPHRADETHYCCPESNNKSVSGDFLLNFSKSPMYEKTSVTNCLYFDE